MSMLQIKKEPATKKQKIFMKKLNIEFDPSISKFKASVLIKNKCNEMNSFLYRTPGADYSGAVCKTYSSRII